MKSAREIAVAIIASKPQRITIDAVQANGDVAFHVGVKECGLDKDICSSPAISRRFLVNFLGEMLVRENIGKFSEILCGLDPAIQKKMVCAYNHTDFGMVIDHKMSMMTFQMHLSLVQEIMTEMFGQGPAKGDPQSGGTILDGFDASGPPSRPPDNEESSED